MTRLVAFATAALISLAAAAQDRTWGVWAASSSPADKRMVAQVERVKWWTACVEWGRLFRSNRNPKLEEAYLARIRDEALLNDTDLGHVGDASVAVGMTQCGVLAAIGMPDGGINTSESAYGESAQLVYRTRNMYVYTEAGKTQRLQLVTTIQR